MPTKKQVEDGMTAQMNAAVAPKHRPFTSADRAVLTATIKQYGAGDHGFEVAAKTTGRFMYECREEYRRAIGVDGNAPLSVIREGRGRAGRFRHSAPDD